MIMFQYQALILPLFAITMSLFVIAIGYIIRSITTRRNEMPINFGQTYEICTLHRIMFRDGCPYCIQQVKPEKWTDY